MQIPEYLEEIKHFLLERDVPEQPEAVIILGSGLGDFGRQINNPTTIPYASIPHFPVTSVIGHKGTLISGQVRDKKVIAFSGRFHYYEGFSFEQTALPVYLAKKIGARKLIISNAAGAINTSFSVGDLMVIEDVMRQNVSISPKGSQRFRYSHYQQVEKVRKLAAELGIVTQQGTYMYVKGPHYETKAEIRAFRIMGADAVGMSTVPELTEAARLGVKATAISMITNMATGVTKGKLSHDEVAEAAKLKTSEFSALVKSLVENL
ncbi:MAG: purine-nucleoside phosphorylase [Balneolaceae bacterium]|nr:purine-nucleoside phosphorylase [Balneolaceae bacterium]